MNRSPRTFFNSLYIYVCLPRSIASRPSCLQTLRVRRIPRGARESSANKLATILDAIVAKNIETSWNRLFHFPSRCLRSPARGGHRRSRGRSLASQVNDAIRRECDDYLPSPTTTLSGIQGSSSQSNPILSLRSAGGPEGLRPQHIKDMVCTSAGGGVSHLLRALTALVLKGKTAPFACPFSFWASLIALEKTGGGVRPIAVGCTLRRLVAKCVGNHIMHGGHGCTPCPLSTWI